MFDWMKRNIENETEAERARLMNLSEKELMIEMILELKHISEQCDEIGRKIVIWSNRKTVPQKTKEKVLEVNTFGNLLHYTVQ